MDGPVIVVYSIEETGWSRIGVVLNSVALKSGIERGALQSGLDVSGRDATIDDKERRLWRPRVEEMSIHTLVDYVRISRENR